MVGKLLAVIASGLMLAAALPKFNMTFFLWGGLIPLLWALQGVQGRKAFVLGYCHGLAQNLAMLYWIIYVTVIYGKLPLPVGVILLLLLAGYISLYRGFWACSTPGESAGGWPAPGGGRSCGSAWKWCRPI